MNEKRDFATRLNHADESPEHVSVTEFLLRSLEIQNVESRSVRRRN